MATEKSNGTPDSNKLAKQEVKLIARINVEVARRSLAEMLVKASDKDVSKAGRRKKEEQDNELQKKKLKEVRCIIEEFFGQNQFVYYYVGKKSGQQRTILLSEPLRQLLAAHIKIFNISTDKLAKQVGCTRQVISKLLNRHNANYHIFLKIIEACDFEASWSKDTWIYPSKLITDEEFESGLYIKNTDSHGNLGGILSKRLLELLKRKMTERNFQNEQSLLEAMQTDGKLKDDLNFRTIGPISKILNRESVIIYNIHQVLSYFDLDDEVLCLVEVEDIEDRFYAFGGAYWY